MSCRKRKREKRKREKDKDKRKKEKEKKVCAVCNLLAGNKMCRADEAERRMPYLSTKTFSAGFVCTFIHICRYTHPHLYTLQIYTHLHIDFLLRQIFSDGCLSNSMQLWYPQTSKHVISIFFPVRLHTHFTHIFWILRPILTKEAWTGLGHRTDSLH